MNARINSSGFSELEEIVLQQLADGYWHSIREIGLSRTEEVGAAVAELRELSLVQCRFVGHDDSLECQITRLGARLVPAEVKIGNYRLSPTKASVLIALRSGEWLDRSSIKSNTGQNIADNSIRLALRWLIKERMCERRVTRDQVYLYRITDWSLAALPPRNPASRQPRRHPVQGGQVRGPSQPRSYPLATKDGPLFLFLENE